MGKIGKLIGKWRSLSGPEKWIFLRAVWCLLWIKAGLLLLPFSLFRKWYHRLSRPSRVQETAPETMERTVWAVDTAANLLPFELLCLPRALATKYLLRNSPALTLEIGIEINPTKQFEAHAWVEQNGNIIIGRWPDTVSYKRLWVWE
ncbi:MAG: lasso peptide biosynthesis B2 protein [Dyadobacter sp.]|uniref:lasso peptide biosynthesis B2 protein n=1 Tax=Dyadobacter sp. TaxID=1914288 RepID=UPI001B141E11|nr:lasso peptide biosynthesis B2 protein [Dyadobacter sp.]MBO9613787.1 lasso peptide biosynthesis B2 protein [Dyadobacter sp.]